MGDACQATAAVAAGRRWPAARRASRSSARRSSVARHAWTPLRAGRRRARRRRPSGRRCRGSTSASSQLAQARDDLGRPAAEDRVVAAEQPAVGARRAARRRGPPRAPVGCRGCRRAARRAAICRLHGRHADAAPARARPTPPALFALASDPEVTRWFSWGPVHDARGAAGLHRAPRAAQRERGEQLDLARRPPRARRRSASSASPSTRAATAARWSAPGSGRRFWGTGANREAKALIFHLAFETLGLERLGAYSNVDNERSTRALPSARLPPRGRAARAGTATATRAYDVNVFGLLREEWAAGAAGEAPGRARGRAAAAFVDAGRQSRRCSQLKPRTAKKIAEHRPHARHGESPRWSAEPARRSRIARRQPVDDVRERQRLGDVAQERGALSTS